MSITKLKEREKYQDLKFQIQRLWNIEVISLVIGALGSITCELEDYLKTSWKSQTAPSIKTALLGSAHYLRKNLEIRESW